MNDDIDLTTVDAQFWLAENYPTFPAYVKDLASDRHADVAQIAAEFACGRVVPAPDAFGNDTGRLAVTGTTTGNRAAIEAEERPKFEQFMRDNLSQFRLVVDNKYRVGGYVDRDTDNVWVGWLARARSGPISVKVARVLTSQPFDISED